MYQAAKLWCENTRGIHYRMLSRTFLSISLYFVNYSDTLYHSIFCLRYNLLYLILCNLYTIMYCIRYAIYTVTYIGYAYGYCGFGTTTLRRAQYTAGWILLSHMPNSSQLKVERYPSTGIAWVFINCFSITYTVLLFTCLGLSKDNVVHNTVLTRLWSHQRDEIRSII